MSTRIHASNVSQANDGLVCRDDQPFTGIAYTEYPDGMLRSETSYQEGLRWGLCREWSKKGALMDEAEFYKDVIHGIAREWTSRGVLVSESVCEFGITKIERRWDEDGNLIDEFHLKESDSNFALLQSFRKAYGPASK